jgi:hypothetical protein
VGEEAERVLFANGRSAALVRVKQGENPYTVMTRLGVRQPKAVILVSGGANSLDEKLAGRLKLLFNRGVARAAAQSGALIIDGGTDSGVMALTGAAVAERGDEVALMGVLPQGKAGYKTGEEAQPGILEPQHGFFVLVEGEEYGSETAMMFSLAEALTLPIPRAEVQQRVSPASSGPAARLVRKPEEKAKPTPARLPAAVVLAGGGEGARLEIVQAVRRGWPVIIIEGSGGLADELAGLLRSRPVEAADPDIAEIIEEGNLYLAGIDLPAGVLRQKLVNLLGGNELLKLAWMRYGMYSEQSKRHRRLFHRMQEWILALGVITTLFVVINAALQIPNWADGLSRLPPTTIRSLNALGDSLDPWLYVIILVLPIVTSALIAISTRMNSGTKYVLLRSSAEDVKREIMRYRTNPGLLTAEKSESAYAGEEGGEPALAAIAPSELLIAADAQTTRELELYRCLERVDTELMQSPVVESALPEYTGKFPPGSIGRRGDDGLSFLTPQRYIYLRLDEQLDHYRKKTGYMERELQRVQIAAIVVGSLGTFLAAVRLELWVALTAAIVTALGAYLHFRQTQNTLVRYNTTASNLESVVMWWYSLTPDQHANPQNVQRLVETTEKILESESVGWLAQMRSAIAELSKKSDGESDNTN